MNTEEEKPNIFARLLAGEKPKPKPFPPPLEPGYTRIKFLEIVASSEKATYFKLEGGDKIWIPRSCHVIRFAPIERDNENCVDIINWFYDKNIGD